MNTDFWFWGFCTMCKVFWRRFGIRCGSHLQWSYSILHSMTIQHRLLVQGPTDLKTWHLQHLRVTSQCLLHNSLHLFQTRCHTADSSRANFFTLYSFWMRLILCHYVSASSYKQKQVMAAKPERKTCYEDYGQHSSKEIQILSPDSNIATLSYPIILT